MKRATLLLLIALLLVSISNAQKSQPINVMSYNIRLNTAADGVNAWPNRKDNVKALVKFYDTDILCVQEALPEQFDALVENTDFDVVGVGRDDGKRKGEFSAIYFKGVAILSKSPRKSPSFKSFSKSEVGELRSIFKFDNFFNVFF